MVIEVNGIELYWEEIGHGEPLLWLHGGMGCGADWRYVFKEPPSGYRLIAPDLRGHGASTNPPGSCASAISTASRSSSSSSPVPRNANAPIKRAAAGMTTHPSK